jgi:uncharacterized protein YjbI with pentapeptide repeats
MSKDNKQSPSFLVRFFQRLRNTFFSFVNAIAESITSSVHIPDIAIGPIVGSLITSITTLIIGFVTLSNLFSEQFLYRPLQIQDSNANYNLELERYHQRILTDYLNHTTQLILDYPAQKLQQNHYLLRAITQTTLADIDGERKRYLVIFLRDNFLLEDKNYPVFSLLEGSDLKEAKLDKLNLSSVNLQGADLNKANLSQSKLNKSNLSQAILTEANLSNSDLRGVNLEMTNLKDVKLTNACYDKLTRFPQNFDPDKAQMRLIKPFDKCSFITTEKNIK